MNTEGTVTISLARHKELEKKELDLANAMSKMTFSVFIKTDRFTNWNKTVGYSSQYLTDYQIKTDSEAIKELTDKINGLTDEISKLDIEYNHVVQNYNALINRIKFSSIFDLFKFKKSLK